MENKQAEESDVTSAVRGIRFDGWFLSVSIHLFIQSEKILNNGQVRIVSFFNWNPHLI